MKTYQHYINGALCDPASGEWFDSENPYTGEVWAKIARGNAEDVDRAVTAAKAAFDGDWGATGPTARGKLMVKLAEIIEREAVRLGEIEVRDNGKLIAEMGAQTKYLAEWYRYFGGLADKIEGAVIPSDKPGIFNFTRYEPLGVIGIIYESRPNVTIDAAGLCIIAGNAAILRGGSDSQLTASLLAAIMGDGLAAAGLPRDAVQMVPTTDRQAVGAMLGAVGGIDVLIPRGGRSLVERVQTEARVPVFAHLEGICHLYIHADADPDKARQIAVNAKMRRTGICGAAETLLIDAAIAKDLLGAIANDLLAAGCALRGDAAACDLVPAMTPATETDFYTEYLDAILSVAIVDNIESAIAHIAKYGSAHTDAIITESATAAAQFFAEVDSAIVMHNASTQFADGGEFGMGAEIGIATGRLHARGPVGAAQLTSFKYVVRGNGQTRS